MSSLTRNQIKGTSNRIESELLDERKAAYIVVCAQTLGPIASEKVRIEQEIEVPEELEDSVYCHKSARSKYYNRLYSYSKKNLNRAML